MPKPLSLNHFNPCTTWIKVRQNIILDQGTQEYYFEDERECCEFRFKCLQLAIMIPFVATCYAAIIIAQHILILISLYDFWRLDPLDPYNQAYNFRTRLLEAGKNVIGILMAPIYVLLLECSALYGIISPRDGRKLYASSERLAYGAAKFAVCFPPKDKYATTMCVG